jgi:ankyrin repeat protein
VDDATVAAHAEANGFGLTYSRSEDFRQVYRDHVMALEALPEHLASRAADLPYPQLHNACLAGDSELVAALLDAGLGPDVYPCLEDDEDDTPLEWLAEESTMDFTLRTQVAQQLIDADAHLDEALFRAVENGDESFAEFLRDRGAEDES